MSAVGSFKASLYKANLRGLVAASQATHAPFAVLIGDEGVIAYLRDGSMRGAKEAITAGDGVLRAVATFTTLMLRAIWSMTYERQFTHSLIHHALSISQINCVAVVLSWQPSKLPCLGIPSTNCVRAL